MITSFIGLRFNRICRQARLSGNSSNSCSKNTTNEYVFTEEEHESNKETARLGWKPIPSEARVTWDEVSGLQ